MSRRRIVVDTNVLISAMLSKDSVSRKVLDHIEINDILLLSEAVLAEFLTILLSDKFDKYVTLQNRYHYLHLLIQNVSWVTITEHISICRDPDDDKFLELAVNGNADFIVTGDKDLLVLHPFGEIPVLKPRDFFNR